MMISRTTDVHTRHHHTTPGRREDDTPIIGADDPILVTGANGFIGARLVKNLLDRGFRKVRCFIRPSGKASNLEGLCGGPDDGQVEVVTGNLLSREDCTVATNAVAVVFHLAAGRGQKSFAEAFMNSVVTTRNLIEASGENKSVRRIVHVSSFAVYSNRRKPRWRLLDESCPLERHPESSGDAYSFAKIKQEEMVSECCGRRGIPYVIVRPGYVIGPGNPAISGRVGIGTFGVFIHLGGSNEMPFTYVDNCAEAIALAGLKKGVDGEVFNIIDDDLPSSREFLRLYKQHLSSFTSLYVPHFVSYAGCYLWERYSAWSEGQLPPIFNRRLWHTYWKKTRYSNQKLKTGLGWAPTVPMGEGLRRYFESCRDRRGDV